ALKWYVDAEGCLDYWNVVESGCGICFRVCSFNKKPGLHHDVVKWFIRNVPALNKFWVWSDDVMGYGKRVPPEKFWE
ncbi:reductive dehalogenase, partial [Candidatus Bathyarchaeota archaeon]|nr:reductive dehalogenase [Candidatus Bathyarchaeota archaeon]